MTLPKISVIIPAYNAASYLPKALERVFRQEVPAYEVIVVNDGSTDDTEKVLEGFRGKVIHKTIPNSGCAAARNEAVRLSSGDALAFLDADDLWFENKLKVVSEYLQKFPEAGFVCSNYLVFSERHGRIVRHYDYLPNRGQFDFNESTVSSPFGKLLANNFVGTPSAVVVRRKTFEEIGGFDPECRLVEDLDFFFRAAAQTRFLMIQEPLLYKHTHEKNMSYDKIKLYEGHKRVLGRNIARHREFLKKNRLEQDAALGMAGVNYILGTLYFESGGKKRAYTLYWEALREVLVPSNFLGFFWVTLKKTVRLLTRDIVSRKNLKRFFKPGP